MASKARRLTLYGRGYCHLCEEMLAALRPLVLKQGWALEVVDVDRDAALESKYGERVPVLVAQDGSEVCWGRVDPAELAARLLEIR